MAQVDQSNSTDHELVRVTLGGLSCASCVNRAQTAIAAVNGVVSADVNLVNGKANIHTLGPAKMDLIEVAAANAGYPVVKSTSPQSFSDHQHDEIADLQRSFFWALILSLPVFLVEMGGHLVPQLHHLIGQTIGHQTSRVLQFVLASIVLLGPGRVFFAKGIPALLQGRPEMNSLVALGAGAAWAYSSVVTFAPQLLPQASRAVYFESAVVIVTLILLGRLLEERAKGQAGEAIKRLVELQPSHATVLRDGKPVKIAIAQIEVGDHLQLHPGERVAVDGYVVSGSTWIDESMITGEPVPVEKTDADAITAGTINGTGVVVYVATAVGGDTMLSRIIDLVETAQGTKLPVQALVDRITGWFVPAVIVCALCTIVLWLIFGPEPVVANALIAGVSVLIIACPCAMGMATPMSIMVGTGRAAERGALFRRGDALQRLNQAKTIAFDKTGTLTVGRPELDTFEVTEKWEKAQALRLVASLEARSEHPIGQALLNATDEALFDVEEFEALPGFGVRGVVEHHKMTIGAQRLMDEDGIDVSLFKETADQLAVRGKSGIYAVIDGELVALFSVDDPIKETSQIAISGIKGLGLPVAMITGDGAESANAIAQALEIDNVQASVLPEGKASAVTALGEGVVFVGDGINDAPALASADVGIAVATGTDVAIEAADVVLTGGDLNGVLAALSVSRATMRNIRQNLFWAFGYNVLLIPVAAGVFYPLFGWQMSPMLAAGAMALSSVFVVTNALRLRRA